MRLTLSLILWCILPFVALTQSQSAFTGCGTMAMGGPEQQTARDALDLQYQQFRLSHQQLSLPKSILSIPVVVHIIHNGGSENISDAQVQTAISHFNERFAKETGNQIQFCLAQRDPNGNPTTGITRNQSAYTVETMEIDDIALKNINRWPPTCYLNIWVVQEILSLSSGSGVAGYAYFPSSAGQPEDGIVIEANYFGSSAENDAIGTHEIGHYLGLYHTFEGGCTNNNCLADGDRVCDTPPDQTVFASCVPPTNSCATDAVDVSSNNPFTTDVPDQSENYMDYSSLSCYDLFSDEQYGRMLFFLSGARSSLLNCMSCMTPCPSPSTATINAPAATLTVTTGSSVNFSGSPWNGISEEWYLATGSVLGSGSTYSHIFIAPGTYWMKYRVANADPIHCLDGLDSVKIIVQDPVTTSCAGSLLFDANAIGVELPADNSYYSGTNGGYTWECWFRLNSPATTQVRPLISAVDAVVFEDQWLGFGWNGGYFNEPVSRLVFKVDGPNSTVPSGPNCSYEPGGGFVIGTWYHAAGVMNYSTQTATLYVDGQAVDSKPITTPPITRVIPTYLSYLWSGGPTSLFGNMDEVRIWERALSATEIAANYNHCISGTESDLVRYYRCDQSSGSTVIDATPASADAQFTDATGWSEESAPLTGTQCAANCIEICGNGVDDNGDGQIDENCECPQVNAGADTVTCTGYPVQLQASPGFLSYSWTPVATLSDPTISNPLASPSVPTDYIVTTTSVDLNLVVNADFSAGNVGFTNGYTMWGYSPGNYDVSPNVWGSGYNTPADEKFDHTPTSDNMMIMFDGSPTPNTALWEQNIAGLTASTDYQFSFWASRAGATYPEFEVHMIGDITGDQIIGTLTGLHYEDVDHQFYWDPYTFPLWNSGSNSSVTIRIINNELNGYGNDFAMDDIIFGTPCSSSDTVHVGVRTPTTEVLDLGPDITLCESATRVLDVGIWADYLWNNGSTNRTLTVFEPGTYWVSVLDSCGATQQDTITISLAPAPTVDAGSDTTICYGRSVQLGYTGSTTFASAIWSPAAGLSCTTCASPIATPGVTTTYSVAVATADGCIAVDNVTISLSNEAGMNFTVDATPYACDHMGAIALQNIGGCAGDCLYRLDGGLSVPVPSWGGLYEGLHTISILTSDGCAQDTIIQIDGLDESQVYIPNTFTPDNKDYNEVWKVEGWCVSEMHCFVLNRWGEVVAELDDISDIWDGNYKGKPVPDGVYTYAINVTYITGRIEQLHGFVTVLR